MSAVRLGLIGGVVGVVAGVAAAFLATWLDARNPGLLPHPDALFEIADNYFGTREGVVGALAGLVAGFVAVLVGAAMGKKS